MLFLGHDGLGEVTEEVLDALIAFFQPLDFDGKREDSAEVTLKSWGRLKRHCMPTEEPELPMISALKESVLAQLPILELNYLITNCKKLVKYLKTSGLGKKLDTSVKQECDSRWNTLVTMMESIDKEWDEVSTVMKISKVI